MLYHVISILSQIYCNGPILKAVQEGNLFPDSKYFVDMTLKIDPVTTLKDFEKLGNYSLQQLKTFVHSHFDVPGTELIPVIPVDWNPHSKHIHKIKDQKLKSFAYDLHHLWKDLSRKVKDDVRIHPEMYSIIYVPNPFIIPGGRFEETYYWDNFWIIKGLLVSEMYQTAKGIIKNLVYLVDKFGYVPNGARIYYTRSQPPFLIQMVYDYVIATGDEQFIYQVMSALDKEFTFWVNYRSKYWKSGDGSHKIRYFQYMVKSSIPRPEAYREDMALASNLTSHSQKENLFSNLASGAESGWDFSSRWFSRQGKHAHKLHSIRTTQLIPVDLNAFQCVNARIMAGFWQITKNAQKALLYSRYYSEAKKELRQIHWNETDGIWYDFDLENKRHVNEYYSSNVVPLYSKCFDDVKTPHKVYHYLVKLGVFKYKKGLPTSLKLHSRQQWDNENAWPPIIHMIIEGFRNSNDTELMEVAEVMAFNWINLAYKSYSETNMMFEKYNVSRKANHASGSGGEYEPQTGFGWANGVGLSLLDFYGDDLFVTK
uniref:Trehalase n=1 Tax=Rhabditophanes sp. KR3021 TaxID=114890 RepID=A0AC35TYJ2_9BILA